MASTLMVLMLRQTRSARGAAASETDAAEEGAERAVRSNSFKCRASWWCGMALRCRERKVTRRTGRRYGSADRPGGSRVVRGRRLGVGGIGVRGRTAVPDVGGDLPSAVPLTTQAHEGLAGIRRLGGG